MAIRDGAQEVLTLIDKFLSTVCEMQGDALAGGIKQTRVLMSSTVLNKTAVKVQCATLPQIRVNGHDMNLSDIGLTHPGCCITFEYVQNSPANLYLDATSQLIAMLRVLSSVVIALNNCIPPNTDQSTDFTVLMPELAQFSGDGDVFSVQNIYCDLGETFDLWLAQAQMYGGGGTNISAKLRPVL